MDLKQDLYICRQVAQRRPWTALAMFLHFMGLHLYARLFPQAHLRETLRRAPDLPAPLRQRIMEKSREQRSAAGSAGQG